MLTSIRKYKFIDFSLKTMWRFRKRFINFFNLLSISKKLEFYKLPDRKLIYLSISKVAGTSIKTCFAQTLNPEWEAENLYDVHRISLKKVNKLNKNDLDNYIFVYVRNPFSRLVSCYKSKLIVDKTIKVNDFKFYFNKKIRNGNISFEEFVDIICHIPNRLCDRHFVPQYYLLKKAGLRHFSSILKLESIEESFPIIAKKYNLKQLQLLNPSGSNENWINYYTAETLRKVMKKYKNDVLKLYYIEEYNDILDSLKSL